MSPKVSANVASWKFWHKARPLQLCKAWQTREKLGGIQERRIGNNSKRFLMALVPFTWFHWLFTFPLSLPPFHRGGNEEGTSVRVALLGSGEVGIRSQALDHHAYYCLTQKKNAVAEKEVGRRKEREWEMREARGWSTRLLPMAAVWSDALCPSPAECE